MKASKMVAKWSRRAALFSALVTIAAAQPGAAFAQATPPDGVQCYPGTAENPLEAQVVVKGSGGTYWETFQREIADPFSEKCGVEVIITAVSGQPFSQTVDLVARNQAPWDISLVNRSWERQQGIDTETFEPFPAGFWDPIAQDLQPGSFDDYTTWQSLSSNVLIYNTQIFPEGIPDWAAFWDTETYPGPRTMQESSPFNIIVALLADGVPAAEIHPITDDKLVRAFEKLNELRPSIASFWTSTDQPIQGVHRGDFVAGVAYSGRAYAGIQSGYNLGINWAGNVFQESWFFRLRGAANPNAAAALLYFKASNPEAAAGLARATGYSYANKHLNEYLTEDEIANLSTTHIPEGVAIDNAWWAENGARTTALWNEWVATGQIPAELN